VKIKTKIRGGGKLAGGSGTRGCGWARRVRPRMARAGRRGFAEERGPRAWGEGVIAGRRSRRQPRRV